MWPVLPLRVFSTQVCFFSRPGCLRLIMKIRVKSGFSEVINLSATSMCSINNYLFNVYYSIINVTLHNYSLFMRTSGENVSIWDEAERVQSILYPQIRSLSRSYTVYNVIVSNANWRKWRIQTKRLGGSQIGERQKGFHLLKYQRLSATIVVCHT